LRNNKKIFEFAGIFDYPIEKRKIHNNPISLSGGLIILLSFIISIILITNDKNLFENSLIIFFSISFYLIGYFDDKNNIKPLKKTILNIFLIILFLLLSKQFILSDLKSIYLNKTIQLENYGILFTMFCFITFLNALNMYDGINGQSGIYILFVIIYFFVLTQKEIFLLMTIPILFFLYMNFKNKCFLGNSGVTFVSFIILVFFIDNYKQGYFSSVEEILVIMILPGIEMIRLFFFRILKSKNPFYADNFHIHHLLLNYFNPLKVVTINSFLAISPIIFYKIFNYSYLVILCFLILYFFLIFYFKLILLNRKL
tara:strand:+ start:552 stop:1490 length:939 start_codon:yes stop_codon:yes gene_type:complete